VAVRILVANATVAAVNDKFATLTPREISARIDGPGLRVVNRSHSTVALAPDGDRVRSALRGVFLSLSYAAIGSHLAHGHGATRQNLIIH